MNTLRYHLEKALNRASERMGGGKFEGGLEEGVKIEEIELKLEGERAPIIVTITAKRGKVDETEEYLNELLGRINSLGPGENIPANLSFELGIPSEHGREASLRDLRDNLIPKKLYTGKMSITKSGNSYKITSADGRFSYDITSENPWEMAHGDSSEHHRILNPFLRIQLSDVVGEARLYHTYENSE